VTARNLRCIPSIALSCLAAFLPTWGKSADDYFHGAAGRYVAGKIQEASVEAEEGLRLHPDDARLRTLAAQLDKMKDQQRGNSGGDGDKDPQNRKDQKNGKDEKNRKDPKDPKNPGDDPKDKNKDGNNGQQPPDPSGEGDRNGKGAVPPGKMSEEEAKRLLNSFADDEKKEQAERRRVIRQRAGTEQQW
jgi:hypothetical protein